mmetsp:Transcript_4294/g.10477  ORF Transcript_4294/g.10477 Transcript_4294/m.10477 type:complete len:242 (-) Transcript_4294:282-1007(-)
MFCRMVITFFSSSWSRSAGPSPAMLPNAHTHCSQSSGFSADREFKMDKKASIPPAETTAAVWSGSPLATFVSAHASSNLNLWSSVCSINLTMRGTRPLSITSLMGGSFVRDSRFRISVAACSIRDFTSVGTPPAPPRGLVEQLAPPACSLPRVVGGAVPGNKAPGGSEGGDGALPVVVGQESATPSASSTRASACMFASSGFQLPPISAVAPATEAAASTEFDRSSSVSPMLRVSPEPPCS